MRLCSGQNPQFGSGLKIKVRPVVLSMAFLFWLGCGYSLVGAPAVGAARTIYLSPVTDEGKEPLFGAILGQALSREAVDRGDMAPSKRQGAEYSLLVEVLEVSETGAAYVAPDVVREYLLEAVAVATLKDVHGEILWKDRSLKARREYSTAANPALTEEYKNEAISLLAGDLSREILRRASLAIWTKSK